MSSAEVALAVLLRRAGWNPRQLVAAINAKLASQCRSHQRLDPTAGYSWVKGSIPHAPYPELVAEVLEEQLGIPIRVDDIWPGRRTTNARRLPAAANLDRISHVDDLLRELNDLVAVAGVPRSPIGDASGSDLTATVLDQLRGAVLAPRNRPDREYVLPEQAHLIASHVTALRKLDDRHGGGALSLRYVTAELKNVIDLVKYANYDKATGEMLFTVVADLAQLLGWLHFDSSRYGPAERYLLLSIGVCRALKAQDRAANVIGMLSYVSAFAGHGSEAVRLAQAAVAECRSPDPVLRARLLGREATAAAADGDLSGFHRYSEEAAGLLEQSQTGGNPSFLYYLSPMQLAAEAGQGLVVLAERTTSSRKRLLNEGIERMTPALSAMVRPDADGSGPAYARSGLLHMTFLARAHLHDGNLPETVAAMRTAIGLLPVVQSPRGRNYLRGLRPALARRCRSRAVAEFLPELDAALLGA